jgi:hypothetical protein
LKVSAIFPVTPVHEAGSRTEKSPSRMACIRSNIRANSAGAVSTATAELPLSRVDFPSPSLTNDVFVLFIYFSRNAPSRHENGEGSSETHLISRDEVTSNSIRDPRQIRESIQPDAFLFVNGNRAYSDAGLSRLGCLKCYSRRVGKWPRLFKRNTAPSKYLYLQ